ncbi:3-phosphoshikimate 1-carboxyvinyltransferase [Saccharopolyspora erythraea]|uniref:3-phosphoshikimate 1-carboxyvinyltransferase n=1 Tax=Saccharopolyspora erythraea TaxID=1836 RepID=UPI001BAD23FF|nr:3-phosphoshikimate 1-carboxyvinyltransferase [Saccharopolyspora erythraea]QUH01861.1 3-phosphoshikimate 1-carboxyvinyltransferase [Saccharopolyspora erythraea]
MTTADKARTLDLDEIAITPVDTVDATIEVLGSKSYTNRFLAIAGLCSEPTTLHNALLSQDTVLLAEALRAFGHVDVVIDDAANTVAITPNGREMRAPAQEIHMGNAGTPIRLLISMASLAQGTTTLTGNERMQERPMGHLLEALAPLGVSALSVRRNGSPPIMIEGPSLDGGTTGIHGTVSSQFTTSLLITAPHAGNDVDITLLDDLVSKPYVDMTVAAMRRTGVTVDRRGYEYFSVKAGQQYQGGDITVEPDASGMSYFLAAAAITGGRVRIPGINGDSAQGDVGLVSALVKMGCRADVTADSITLEGGSLTGIDIDMSNMPDVAPTLAVVAAYAQGRTHITGIGNLRVKECDRIDAVSTELSKMGVNVDTTIDTMTIRGGGEPKGAVIDTYDDHRIAMAFAIAGLRTPGVVIRDPGCVRKSFPSFWQRLDDLRGKSS